MQDFSSFNSKRVVRRGFTLVEVLVVLTIIVLIAASALPAFRFITGSRSLESTQNIIGAMIGRARTAAVISHQPHGIFFFIDPVNDRTTLALVRQEGDNTPNPDLDAYKAWTNGQDQVRIPTSPVTPAPFNLKPTVINYYESNDMFLRGPSFANKLTIKPGGQQFHPASPLAPIIKPTFSKFKCVKSHSPANASNTPRNTAFWSDTSPLFLDVVANTDFQLLPPGVGVQLINDQKGFVTVGPKYNDRYLRTGCIMLDANGQFTSIEYDVLPDSKLGKSLKLPPGNTLENQTYVVGGSVTATAASYGLYSQFGVVLYDRQTFKAATATTVAPVTPFVPSDESDWMTRNVLTSFAPPASAADEQNEETWLDQNAQPLILNRYNATLIKGE